MATVRLIRQNQELKADEWEDKTVRRQQVEEDTRRVRWRQREGKGDRKRDRQRQRETEKGRKRDRVT